MKPKRKEPPAYYEARELIAECFGLNEDSSDDPCADGCKRGCWHDLNTKPFYGHED